MMQALDIPSDGLVVWLRDFGQVKLFRTYLKDQARHYVMYLPDDNDSSNDGEKFNNLNQVEFDKLHSQHWQIEQIIVQANRFVILKAFRLEAKLPSKIICLRRFAVT